jgi:hypothetical protein
MLGKLIGEVIKQEAETHNRMKREFKRRDTSTD